MGCSVPVPVSAMNEGIRPDMGGRGQLLVPSPSPTMVFVCSAEHFTESGEILKRGWCITNQDDYSLLNI